MSAATLGTPPAGVKRVTSRLARAASITARVGVLLTLIGALSLLLSGAGSRWDWWDFRTGFAIFRWTLYGGLGAVVVALAGLVLALLGRAYNTAVLSIGTLVLLAAIAVVPVSHLRNAGQVPPIHDITTDLDDPPRFVAVLPRRQGAPNAAEYGGPALAAQQRAGYPDLAPARFSAPPDRVFARAVEVARALGWEIVAAAPADGRLEATDRTAGSASATTSWYASVRTVRAPAGRPLGFPGRPQRSRHQRAPDPRLPGIASGGPPRRGGRLAVVRVARVPKTSARPPPR